MSALDHRLLKSVSRSFYLSIRLLPAKVRAPIAIAYLLARTSDTIADTPGANALLRLRRLGDFEGLVRGTPSPHAIAAIQRDIVPEHRGERALIAALPEVLESFSKLEMWNWKETSELLGNIIRGQGNDLETFNDPGRVIALPDESALDDYIYLVAGCVGEWWTRVCFHHLPDYARVPEEHLTPLASAFGKALQLVNILRDMPEDLAAGRCYLPADELRDAGVEPDVLGRAPAEAQPVYTRWLARARELLADGRSYIASIRTRRIRIACYIPWRLGTATLDLLEKRPPILTGERVKVPRSAVRAAFWRGLCVAFSNKAL
jgi:farnesyl-diphosphate farnesyltransferase